MWRWPAPWATSRATEQRAPGSSTRRRALPVVAAPVSSPRASTRTSAEASAPTTTVVWARVPSGERHGTVTVPPSVPSGTRTTVRPVAPASTHAVAWVPAPMTMPRASSGTSVSMRSPRAVPSARRAATASATGTSREVSLTASQFQVWAGAGSTWDRVTVP